MKLTDEQQRIIKVLKHYYDISPSDEEVVIPSNDLTRGVNAHKTDLILKKFSKDYDIISYISSDANLGNNYIDATIIFTDDFESFYDENVTKEEERYLQEIHEAQEKNRLDAEFDEAVFGNSDNAIAEADNEKVYWLTYSDKTRKLILNNCLVITKTQSNSNPDKFLSYIFNNQNRPISIAEIQEKDIEIKRDFHKILDDLYFRGAVRKLFFSNVSKTSITFHDTVSKQQLQEAGIEQLQLSDFIRNQSKTIRNNPKVAS